jgi:hypothetical protein
MSEYHEFKSLPFHTNIGRRRFLKSSLAGGFSLICLPLTTNTILPVRGKLKYDLSLDSPTRLFDGKYCWTHPRAGIVPGAGKEGSPRVVMTMTYTDLSGSDIFRATYGLYTDDLGLTWTSPKELDHLRNSSWNTAYSCIYP